MPVDLSGMPDEVQTAFFMLGFLPDVWEGMSGTYMGKDWSSLEYFFNLYEIEEQKVIVTFMKLYERILVNYRIEQQKQQAKKAERSKSARSGSNFTHNIKG